VPAPSCADVPFSYCILRFVPSAQRGERLNVGVVLFCRQRRFLGIRLAVDRARLSALAGAGWAGEAGLEDHLRGLVAVAEGRPDAGPIAALDASDRFGWLAAPSSTVVQPSRVHTGLCGDPAATLDALYEKLVAAERPVARG
jgi:hypothetical protein